MHNIETLNHPNATKAIEKRGGKATFPDFSNFIDTEGLSSREQKIFTKFLSDIFNITGESWLPSNCYAMENMRDQVRHFIRDKTEYRGFMIDIMNYGNIGTHFWLRLNMNGKNIAIDPTGTWIRGNWMEDNSGIIPYFGLISQSPPRFNEVYNSSTADSTRQFRP